jgi:ABC-2 type transport system ATP-binding protein
MSLASAIHVENLVKRFGDFVAVDRISLDVAPGEIFGFLGPNGAGKTTTIRILLGLLPPTSGRVEILGLQVPRQIKTVHCRTGYMSQLFTLYRDLTAVENIDFYGRVYGLREGELARRRSEIIEMAGLRGHERELTLHLSGGWRQRLALGCAIIHRPELLFLDEPTAGMDPVSRREFWEMIYGLARRQTTVFVTTHYMDEAEHCQRVAFIDNGRLVALGAPSELKVTQMRGRVMELDCSDAEGALRVLEAARDRGEIHFDEAALYGARLHVIAGDRSTTTDAIASLLGRNGLTDIRIQVVAPSLEDVFISNMRGGQVQAGAKTGGR